MLSISPVKINSEYKSKIKTQPAFTGNFKMLTCAYDSTKEYFKGQKFLSQNHNFYKGIKHFTKNALEIYKNFGFDGIKCLYAESFLGHTNMKAMKKIMIENVKAASEHLNGEIILGEKAKVYSENVPNLLVMYKPSEFEKETHQAISARAPEEYFPQHLSVNNIIKTVNNIVFDAEEALLNGKVLNTKY